MRFLLSFFRRSKTQKVGDQPTASLIKSIERDAGQELAYLGLLDAYEKKGDIDGAITYLKRLVERKPRIDNPYRYLLAAYRRKGDLDGLKGLPRRYRKNQTAHDWFLMDAYAKRDWDGAIALLSALVEIHPGDDRWVRYLLTAYREKGDQDVAMAGLTKLFEACPGSEALRRHLEERRNTGNVGTARLGNSGEPADHSSRRERISPVSAGRSQTEFEKSLELRTKLQQIEAKDRERKRIEHELRSRPRALTPREKFNSIKSTGSRDSFR